MGIHANNVKYLQCNLECMSVARLSKTQIFFRYYSIASDV